MFRLCSHSDSEIDVRQVDQDELTYALFSALRGWSVSTRREVFEARKAMRREIMAKLISDKLRVYEIVDGSGAALTREARAQIFDEAIRTFPGAIGKLWLCPMHERQDDARRAAAVLLYRALEPYQVLSPSPYGETLFFRAIEAPAYALAPTWP